MSTKQRVITTAILTARNYTTNVTVKVGAILENEDGSDFILINKLIDYKDFSDPRRVDNGHVKLHIINKEDYRDE